MTTTMTCISKIFSLLVTGCQDQFTERRGFHGDDGSSNTANNVAECRTACLTRRERCYGFDFNEGASTGQRCWLFSSSKANGLLPMQGVTHYERQFTCDGGSGVTTTGSSGECSHRKGYFVYLSG